ncbi:flagellar export chaperone FlgN [Tepidanaerobacter sp. EBM-38]|uniref:flagellar export chaperone FlgN n=1 Tax=Tepidanaerobacter sp. EBM-38 TaxID=1918496 RepID=UPI0025E8C8AC|nr:flagellar export chaperone FlgN [Tepidanaerobacter sp. EBM-38]
MKNNPGSSEIMDKDIAGLLKSKLEKLETLYKYTQNISDALKKDDTEELLKILNSRQRLMEEVDSLDCQLLSFFEGNIDAFKEYVADDNKILKAVYDNIGVFLKKIQQLDAENTAVMQKLFSKLKDDISNLKQAENALKGYGIIGKSARDGAFIDTKK